MYTSIQYYCDALISEFERIPEERKRLLEQISGYIRANIKKQKPVHLIYICTHNSRRSHFGQIWAKVACTYYSIEGVNTYSGGTEATAFNGNAIAALKRIGFIVHSAGTGKNPHHLVYYDDSRQPLECFSKVYDDPANPQKNFAAIMTCSDAEENCPFIPGAELRTGTTYDDPKVFDATPQQDQQYDERCRQIALETLYVFSKVKS